MVKMRNLPIFARPALQRIIQNFCADPPVSVSLVGGPLLGKSVILAYLTAELAGADGGSRSVVQVNCAQLGPGTPPPLAPPEGEGAVVLLDNFDAISRWRADERRGWVDWIVSPQPTRGLLLASRCPLYALGTDFGSALPYFQQSFLGLVDGEEAARILRDLLAGVPDHEPLLVSLVEWCGGHPFLLDRMPELLADVAGLLPAGVPIAPTHLPLLRLRLAAAYARLLFDSQWRAIECHDEADGKPIAHLLRQMLRRGLGFDELAPAQAEPMHWLLVQGLVGVDGHRYRLFSPLLQEYLATKWQVDAAAAPVVEAGQDAVHALVERESHRFTPQEKSLLLYFLERPGTIVSVDELLADVWQRPDGSVRRVQEGIRRLRHRLVEFNGAVGTIDNEWGQGYRYVPINGLG